MNLKEDIDKVNKEISDITEKQKRMETEIESLKVDKKTKRRLLIDKNTGDITKALSLNEDIAYLITGENSLSNLWNELYRLYDKSFHGIVTGRINTELLLPQDLQKYDRDKEIWINSRGVAFKPNDNYFSYYAKKDDSTKCFRNLTEIYRIIKLRPRIEDFIEKEDKKDIFKAFHTCFNKWRFPPDRTLKLNQDIYIVNQDSNYNTGVTRLYTTKLDEITIRLDSSFNIMVNEKNNWRNDHRINFNSEKLSSQDKFVLSQLTDETLNEIEIFLNKFIKVHNYNQKLFNELRTEVAPHIMHRMI